LQDVDECPSGAFEHIGRDISLAALEREVMKDDVFFRSSGGGVTLSGGEVLMQAPFATRFLTRLRELGVHTAIETAGDAPFSRLWPLAQQCDEVLFDLKILDEAQSRDVLKINLARVLANLRLLRENGVKVTPRLPLIPGYTLNETNIAKAIGVLKSLSFSELHILPFHQYGEPKYGLLGRSWAMKAIPVPDENEIAAIRIMAEQAGFKVTTGG